MAAILSCPIVKPRMDMGRPLVRGLPQRRPGWRVADIECAPQSLIDAGATVDQAASDVGGGKLIARVGDADGNLVGLMQPAGTS